MSATVASLPAVEDAAAIAHLDFPACCMWDDPECVVPASWVGMWPCCGSKVLMCDGHKEEAVASFKRSPLRHLRCRKVVDHLAWMSLPRGGGRG